MPTKLLPECQRLLTCLRSLWRKLETLLWTWGCLCRSACQSVPGSWPFSRDILLWRLCWRQQCNRTAWCWAYWSAEQKVRLVNRKMIFDWYTFSRDRHWDGLTLEGSIGQSHPVKDTNPLKVVTCKKVRLVVVALKPTKRCGWKSDGNEEGRLTLANVLLRSNSSLW